jgi:hypothetical protein
VQSYLFFLFFFATVYAQNIPDQAYLDKVNKFLPKDRLLKINECSSLIEIDQWIIAHLMVQEQDYLGQSIQDLSSEADQLLKDFNQTQTELANGLQAQDWKEREKRITDLIHQKKHQEETKLKDYCDKINYLLEFYLSNPQLDFSNLDQCSKGFHQRRYTYSPKHLRCSTNELAEFHCQVLYRNLERCASKK